MILPTKVLVRDITNLTDARYFAAWGVDIVAYTGDPHADSFLPPHEMKEIIEWLEGPEHMIMFPGLTIDEDILEKVSLLDIAYLGVSKFIDTPADSSYGIYREIESSDEMTESCQGLIVKTMDIRKENVAHIKDLSGRYEVYIDGINTPDEVKYLLEQLPEAGLVVRGGKEEKTGVKVFDVLDDIYDVLLDYA